MVKSKRVLFIFYLKSGFQESLRLQIYSSDHPDYYASTFSGIKKRNF
jgi:hypothetical protein